jgi:hypothetical protein
VKELTRNRGMFVRLILVAILVLAGLTVHAAPKPRVVDQMILCPTQLVSGCQATVDPLGHPAQPVMCRASHCKLGRTRIVNGQKICSFSCPDFFVE